MNYNRINIARITSGFNPATLEMLDKLDLMNRFDVKYIIPESILPVILSDLESYYNILEIDGKRNFQYINQYFDTKDYFFYKQHHNGKLNRAKVRYRHYVDSDSCFFEIKRRINNSQTIKDRIPIPAVERQITGDAGWLVKKELNINPDLLIPKLRVTYNRLTLLNTNLQEKITIDTDIYFKNTINDFSLNGLALLEIKQKKIGHLSPSLQILKLLYLHPSSSLSKYCIGLIMTDSNLKYNRFKPKILIINKLYGNGNGLQHFDRYSVN
jgi:hypothetical protein